MKLNFYLSAAFALQRLNAAWATANAFTSPLDDFSIHAGQTMEINWVDLSGDTVDIKLLQGTPTDLQVVHSVVNDIQNSGSTFWKIPASIPPGSYAMEIVASNGIINYSPFFTITDAVSMARFGRLRETLKRTKNPDIQKAGIKKLEAKKAAVPETKHRGRWF